MPQEDTAKLRAKYQQTAKGGFEDILATINAPLEVPQAQPLPPLPKQENVPELSTGIRLARAASVLLGSLQSPELGQFLAQQFHQQDQNALTEAQRRFTNAFALAREERTGIMEAGQAQRANRAQALQERGQVIDAKLAALQASLHGIELDLQAASRTGNTDDMEHLSTVRAMTIDMIEQLKQQQGIGKPERVKTDLAMQDIILEGSRRTNPETGEPLIAQKDIAKYAKNPTLLEPIRKEIIRQHQEESKVARPRATVWSEQFRTNVIESRFPSLLALYDQAIDRAPFLTTLDQGDPQGYNQAVAEMAQKGGSELNAEFVKERAKVIMATGWASDMETAVRMAVQEAEGERPRITTETAGAFKQGGFSFGGLNKALVEGARKIVPVKPRRRGRKGEGSPETERRY